MIIKSEVRTRLDALWARGSAKLDWLKFEASLADFLTTDFLDSEEKIRACKELLDAFTRRGHFEPEEYFPTLESVDGEVQS